jgi:CheY-like chemotaxis protein
MAAGERRFRVLIVEDNRDSANVLVTLLKHNGFDATAVYDGSHAVEAAERFQPDCVLSDLGLPGLDGYGVARQFRSHNTLGRIPLVALSAYGDSEEVRAAGFDHHILKPAGARELTRMLTELRNRLAGLG